MAAFRTAVKKESERERKSNSRPLDHDSPIDLTCYSRRNRGPSSPSSQSEDKPCKFISKEAKKAKFYDSRPSEKTECLVSSQPNDFGKSFSHFTSLRSHKTSESNAVDPCNFRPNIENSELLKGNLRFFNSSSFSEYQIAAGNSTITNEEAKNLRRDLHKNSTVISEQVALSSLLLSQLNSNFAKNDVFTSSKLDELFQTSVTEQRGNPLQTVLLQRMFTASSTYPFPLSCNSPLLNLLTSRLETQNQLNTSVSQPVSLADCNGRIEPKKLFVKSGPNSTEEQKTSSFFHDLPTMVASEAQRKAFLRSNELTNINNSASKQNFILFFKKISMKNLESFLSITQSNSQ